jgi:hypothetical protein
VKESAAPAAPACDAQASSKDDTHCLAGATVQPTAASAKPTAASDPIAINTPAATQPVAQAETPPVADRTRADTRASGEKQQRAQSSRSSRRITRRDSADRRAADNTVQSERFFDRWQDREAARWQDRDTGRWQDRDAGRWPDRDADRAYGWRRERYDAYARGVDRGGARAWREDERMNGRPPREEVQPTFAPFRSGW